MASVATNRFVRLPRAFVRVTGPDACDLLERLLSNDVESLAAGEVIPALLLTPKARVIAPVVVHRFGDDEFLLSTEPELAETLRAQLVRARLRSRAEIEAEEHDAWLLLDGEEVVDTPPNGEEISAEEWERHRIERGIPRWGAEIDDRILPAEAGLDVTHVSFEKGCYPGQEPVARLHYRGHPNRTLRRLELEGPEPPQYDAEIVDSSGRAVGRVTSTARRTDGTIVALGYVRAEVLPASQLSVDGRRIILLS